MVSKTTWGEVGSRADFSIQNFGPVVSMLGLLWEGSLSTKLLLQNYLTSWDNDNQKSVLLQGTQRRDPRTRCCASCVWPTAHAVTLTKVSNLAASRLLPPRRKKWTTSISKSQRWASAGVNTAPHTFPRVPPGTALFTAQNPSTSPALVRSSHLALLTAQLGPATFSRSSTSRETSCGKGATGWSTGKRRRKRRVY